MKETHEQKAAYWYKVLTPLISRMEGYMDEFAPSGSLQNVRLKLFLCRLLRTYLSMFVYEGELYLEYEECREIAEKVTEKLTKEAVSLLAVPEDEPEINAYLQKLDDNIYEDPDFSRLALEAVEGVQLPVTEEAFLKEMRDCRWSINNGLYSIRDERKEMNEAPYKYNDSEPPPWLDEFEYIDWVMTH